MEQKIEAVVTLPRVSVQLASVRWDGVEDILPQSAGYNICQRLSDDHAPLRIGNLKTREAFPRALSVGLLPPGCRVRLYPVDRPFRVLNCAYDADWFESVTGLGQQHWDDHMPALVSIKDRRLEVLMQEIGAELTQPGFAHEMLIEAACTMVLVEMARYGQRLGERAAAGQGLAPWQLRRIHERLAAAATAGYPTPGELASLCGISQSHLMRSFKAATGWPIHKFVAEERLREAKRLLLSGEYNAKEIAGRLGFRSPAYFATAFRRMTGKTPSEFRRETGG